MAVGMVDLSVSSETCENGTILKNVFSHVLRDGAAPKRAYLASSTVPYLIFTGIVTVYDN